MGLRLIFDEDRHIVIIDNPGMEPIELPTMELFEASSSLIGIDNTNKKNRMKSILKRRRIIVKRRI